MGRRVVPTNVASRLVGSSRSPMRRSTTMVEGQMMTAADVVASAMAGEHGDLLRDAVALVVRELMEAEVSQLIGAQRGERSPERVTYLNGYRPRVWETRVGEIELVIPRTRSGPAYFPSFLEPRRRCEQAIVAVVMEAYVNGVSTRKVDRLVEQLGIQGMDKDRVSRLCRELDEHVEQFRTRPATGRSPLRPRERRARRNSIQNASLIEPGLTRVGAGELPITAVVSVWP